MPAERTLRVLFISPTFTRWLNVVRRPNKNKCIYNVKKWNIAKLLQIYAIASENYGTSVVILIYGSTYIIHLNIILISEVTTIAMISEKSRQIGYGLTWG